MKNQLLQLGKYLFLSGALLFLGCQAEEATVSSTNLENHASHRHINFEKFSELFPQPASKILQQNDKSTGILNRNGVYDAVNDFTILTDEIFMAEKDGEIYFTFAITRENGDFSGLENLVLSSDGLGGFTPALAKYAITEAEKDKLERGEIVEDIAQKASIVPLENVDFGGISVSGKFTCYTLTISWCGEGNHAGGIDGGHSCPAHQEMTVPLGCDDDGGSNPGGPGGNYPGTPSPGSGAGGGGGGSAPYVPPTNGNPGNPPSNGPQDPGTGMNPGGGGSGSGSGGGGPKKPLITHPLYIPVPPRTIDTFLFYLSAAQQAWWNNSANAVEVGIITDYLNENSVNGIIGTETEDYVKEIITAVINYIAEFGNTSETKEIATDFVRSIFEDVVEEDVEDISLEVAPDCDSFQFTNTGSNWQMSAVSNINFVIALINQSGASVRHVVDYPRPILFGCPRNLAVGNTTITPGMAASLSATALYNSMKDTSHKYANKMVSWTIVNLFFEERLKHNYQGYLPGGRVIIHPQNYPATVIPTVYKSSMFGNNDCE